jgi:DNA-binding NtrC family response regulator
MPDKTALELLAEINRDNLNTRVVVMAPFGTIEECAEAMYQGAAFYVRKPVDLIYLIRIVEKVLSRKKIAADTALSDAMPGPNNTNGKYRKLGGGKSGFETETNLGGVVLVGPSKVMQSVYAMVERIALTESSVLITGATGTGKELIAKAIHDQSRRQRGPFVDINCSAIPESLIEAELFGHERGTFTGADETRKGLFEEASGGTLFLDEVDALIPLAQSKLLRVLQERQLRRVGGRENIAVDVRIISATNRDLEAAVADGLFRADLRFRLRVVPVHVPALKDRTEDIPHLVHHFLRRHAERSGTPVCAFAEDAMVVLQSYGWPGNVRELENTIEYALAMGKDEVLGIGDLPGDVLHKFDRCKSWLAMSPNASILSLAEVERQHILDVLERVGDHHIRAATALGIDRRTLYRRLEEYRPYNHEQHSELSQQVN